MKQRLAMILFFNALLSGVSTSANVGDDLMKITKHERALSFQFFQLQHQRENLKKELDQTNAELTENKAIQQDQKKDFFVLLQGLSELHGGQWTKIIEKKKSLAQMDIDLEISKRAVHHAGEVLDETRAVAVSTENKRQILEQKNQKLLGLQKNLARIHAELASESGRKRRILRELQVKNIVRTPLFFMAKGSLATPVKVKTRSENDAGELFLESSHGAAVRSVFAGKVQAIEDVEPWKHVLVIDHGDNYHSIYMNVQNVKVQVGDLVNVDSEIAQVAEYSLLKKNGIFFEIRHFGIEDETNAWLTQ